MLKKNKTKHIIAALLCALLSVNLSVPVAFAEDAVGDVYIGDGIATSTDSETALSEQGEGSRSDEANDVAESVQSDENLVGASSGTYNDTMAFEVLNIVNQRRAENGLSALKMDKELLAAAKIRAEELTTELSHYRPDGTLCFTVSDKAYGENIAYGYSSASSVMTGWMNSTGHRENILRSGFQSIGVGCYNLNGTLYWVQLFGYAEADEASAPSSSGSSGGNSSQPAASSTVYNGVDYSAVYNYDYYTSKYSDIANAFGSNKSAALAHFVNYGMNEGRQGCESFNVYSYAYKYADLRHAYKNNLKQYYLHYINYGKKEGRAATGTSSMQNCTTTYNGVNYSAVYDGIYYQNKYSDIKKAYGLDDEGMLKHFINYGMKEGRQGCSSFNVYSYAYKYADLRHAYKNNLKQYYLHYINYGKKEGRTATGTTAIQNCTTVYNGVNYSAVYNGSYYWSKYSDLRKVYGLDDEALLKHFVNYGMSEGRQGATTFNVNNYKNRYADLRNAFGNNLKSYYIHYINYGIKEGRNGK